MLLETYASLVRLQSDPSSFPRAALLTTLCVCMRIWDGVGFDVRVSTIKATNLIMIFVSHRVVPSDSIDHLILSYSLRHVMSAKFFPHFAAPTRMPNRLCWQDS